MAIADYVEISADDVKSAIAFYRGLFGWRFEKAPGDSDYWFIKTGDEDKPEEASGGMQKRQMPGQGLTASGGMQKRQMPGQGLTVMIEVPSVDKSLEKLTKLGGKIVMPKNDAMGMVRFAICQDNQNNVFGVWEPLFIDFHKNRAGNRIENQICNQVHKPDADWREA
jgi:predicted enzyme related to lactoylglutathione lyase